MRVARAEVAAQEETAPEYRQGYSMLGCFNLRVAEMALVVDDPGGRAGVVHVRTDFDSTGSVYMRNTFLPRRFYHAPSLGRGDVWFFVLDNKVLAGREARHESDAQTRPLVICFFEAADGAADQLVVRRTDRQFAGMTPMALTPAELALHLGFVLPADAGRTAAESESLVERAWLGIPRVGYAHRQLTDAEDIHTYQLTEPLDAEDMFWNSIAVKDHTKYAIARYLKCQHGWDLERLWKRTLTQLRAAVDSGIAPWDGAAAAPAIPIPRGGRGRGAAGVAAAPLGGPVPRGGRGRGAAGVAAVAAGGPVPGAARGRGGAPAAGRGRGRGAAAGGRRGRAGRAGR